MTQQQEGSGWIKGLLVGAALGVTLGILLAPQEGRRTRAQLAERGRDLGEAAQALARRAREGSGELLEDAAEEIVRFCQRMREFVAEEEDRLREVFGRLNRRPLSPPAEPAGEEAPAE